MPDPSLPLAVFLLALQAAPESDPLPAADPAVTRAELEHHVRFLASDELGGRAPVTPGGERAIEYLARALAAAGIEPAGTDGTFFQATGARRYEYPSLPRLVFYDESGAPVEARYGVDFTLTVRGTARSTEKLLLRFFYDYNHVRMPKEGRPEEAIHFSAAKEDRERILAAKGIEDLGDWGVEMAVLLGDKGLEPGKAIDALPARLTAASEAEECELITLRGPMRKDFERRRFTHVQLTVAETPQLFVDRNVVGRIRGQGTADRPELAAETVLLVANHDHLGVRAAKPGREGKDTVQNGADDNASGCAALLELAQALASGPKPVRTVVFLFLAGGENKGAGALRYLAGPAEPLERTVACLNLERLGRPDELAGGPGHLWLAGYDGTNLGAVWKERGLPIGPDPRSARDFFPGADSHAFALEGIVAQTLTTYAQHEERGTPRDEADTLDYAHLEAVARLALQAAGTLADGSFQPAWVEGKRPQRIQPSEPQTDAEREAERLQRRAEREAARKAREEDGTESEDDGDEDEGDHASERDG